MSKKKKERDDKKARRFQTKILLKFHSLSLSIEFLLIFIYFFHNNEQTTTTTKNLFDQPAIAIYDL